MRLFFSLIVAAALSLLIGLTASQIAPLMPCQGVGLVCNLNEAYGVLIWSCLGPLIFGVILLVASNRVTLLGGMMILLARRSCSSCLTALSRLGRQSPSSLTE